MTSPLLQQIANDIAATAMNTGEYAAERVVNGVPVICTMEDDITVGHTEAGISISGFVLRLAPGVITRPRLHSRIIVDGRVGTVIGTSDALNVLLEIKAQWNDA